MNTIYPNVTDSSRCKRDPFHNNHRSRFMHASIMRRAIQFGRKVKSSTQLQCQPPVIGVSISLSLTLSLSVHGQWVKLSIVKIKAGNYVFTHVGAPPPPGRLSQLVRRTNRLMIKMATGTSPLGTERTFCPPGSLVTSRSLSPLMLAGTDPSPSPSLMGISDPTGSPPPKNPWISLQFFMLKSIKIKVLSSKSASRPSTYRI